MSSNIAVMMYDEIRQPIDMLPIEKDGIVEWVEAKLCLKDTKETINLSLQESFDNTFIMLKMYIDDYNLTYLCFKENFELASDTHEPYDNFYGLNKELKTKVMLWKKELELSLTKIHNLTLKMNELLERKM